MRIFQAGGSVRDRLLGVPPRDRDFLVLDATEDDLRNRGLISVGETFPIFLDRETGDEYTLGKTLEDDLGRRDLTVNALALDETGKLVDLFGGEADLKKKVLRAVKRENFFTDPLRVYRVARFLAQLDGFTIAPETLSLMEEVARTPLFLSLLSERIVKELKNVLATPRPSAFFETIERTGAMGPHFQELREKWSLSVDRNVSEKERFALLTEKLAPEELKALASRLRIQNDWKDFARAKILLPRELSAENLIHFFYAIDAFRNPGVITELSRLSGREELLTQFTAVKDIGAREIDPSLKGKEIGAAIRDARLRFLRNTI